ncbi:hypothetical protein C8R47DRAFT_322791 [Mycena vitilis]|nr:hypothetical protein C8R47DRAFT_322791 [Mycena vitilis]
MRSLCIFSPLAHCGPCVLPRRWRTPAWLRRPTNVSRIEAGGVSFRTNVATGEGRIVEVLRGAEISHVDARRKQRRWNPHEARHPAYLCILRRRLEMAHLAARASTIVLGVSSPAQLLENLAALELLPRITDGQLGRIEDILGNRPETFPMHGRPALDLHGRH